MSLAAPPGPPIRKWTWTCWVVAIAIVFLIHVALIFIFGDWKQKFPRPVKNVPSLVLAGESADGWVALNDATLFALPAHEGFAGLMWIELPPPPPPALDWTEKPRWLAVTESVPASGFGAAFNQFVQTNRFAGIHLDFSLPPQIAAPATPMQPPFAPASTLEINGELAKRPLLRNLKLPSWPSTDVIEPSIVQVLVNAAGNVISATLLPPENFLAALEPPDVKPDAKFHADGRAVELARAARFAPLISGDGKTPRNPLSHVAIGQLIFNWRTAPITMTNGLQ